MYGVQGVKSGLRNGGGDTGKDYYGHDGNTGNGTEGGEGDMLLEFSAYVSKHLRLIRDYYCLQ